jgi:hypothetical protein
MNVIYPPNSVECPKTTPGPYVFLAGSIEMGKAIDWQKQVIDSLADVENVTLLNPRRDDWDISWIQDPDKDPFRSHVLWELTSIVKSSIVFFYFAPETISPISLLELGTCLGTSSKIIVCCPKTFTRYGNVKIYCEVAGVPVYENLEEAINALKERIK